MSGRDVFAMHRRQMERLDLPGANQHTRAKRRQVPARRNRPHIHDRGAVIDGERGCWRCWISGKLGVRP